MTGRNPRPEHTRLNGVTVGIDDPFPNGADWPGDVEHLTADQVANCNCQCAVTMAKGPAPETPVIEVDSNGARMGRYFAPYGKVAVYALEKDVNKARAFREALGYTPASWEGLARETMEWVSRHEPTYRDSTKYGDRYTSDMTLTGLTGRDTRVIAGWIKRNGSDELQLTTVYVKDRK